MSAMVPKFILQPLVENSFFMVWQKKKCRSIKFQIYVKGKRKEYKPGTAWNYAYDKWN